MQGDGAAEAREEQGDFASVSNGRCIRVGPGDGVDTHVAKMIGHEV